MSTQPRQETAAITPVFGISPLPGIAGGLLLSLQADLEQYSADEARREVFAALGDASAAVVLDLTRGFVGAAGIHLVHDIIEGVRVPTAVIGHPSLLTRFAPQLGLSHPLFASLHDALAWLNRPGGNVPATGADPADDLDRIAEQYVRERDRLDERQARRARTQVINELLPFAGRLTRRYRGGREPAEDLEQVARLGLVKAVDRYQPDRGSFTAFAVATITGELKRHFRDHTWGVHVPRRLRDLALAVTHADNALAGELGRLPTDAEVAGRCGVGVADVVDARRSGAGYRSISLSLPIGDDGGQLGDMFGAPDAAVEGVADQLTVRELIDLLPARERRILLERYYGNRTQAEIAADLGVSQMHVSRLLNRTLGWLRTAMLTDEAPPWPANDTTTGPVVAVRHHSATLLQVSVAGEVDRDNAARLKRELLRLVRRAPRRCRLEIDLAAVPLLDAAGVAAVAAVHEAARARHVTLGLTGLQPFVRQIAVVAGLGACLAGSDVR